MGEDTNEANEEDLAFMTRIARGDEEAFRLLIEKHQHAVIGTIAKMTNNSPETEDIAQQVFLRLWKAAPRYKSSSPLRETSSSTKRAKKLAEKNTHSKSKKTNGIKPSKIIAAPAPTKHSQTESSVKS